MNSEINKILSHYETFWGVEEDTGSNKELEDFYNEFFENNDKLKAQIITHEIVEGAGQKYAVIHIDTLCAI